MSCSCENEPDKVSNPSNEKDPFQLSGATAGRQSNQIAPYSVHTYTVPLSHQKAYSLSVADTIGLDSVEVYEGNSSIPLYIKAAPFTSFTKAFSSLPAVTITFSNQVSNEQRYLVLPLATTPHRLILTNTNAEAVSYTLTLTEEQGTVAQPTGRLLVDGSSMGYFTNDEPAFYWVHLPYHKQQLEAHLQGFLNNLSASCIVVVSNTHKIPAVSINDYIPIISTQNRYFILRILNNNDGAVDYRGCQFRFRLE